MSVVASYSYRLSVHLTVGQLTIQRAEMDQLLVWHVDGDSLESNSGGVVADEGDQDLVALVGVG